jgi:hypothetical protein
MEMDLLGGDEGEAGREIEAELMAENAQRAGMRSVVLAVAVFKDVP